MNKTMFSLQLSADLLSKLKQTAQEEQSSVSSVVRRILILYYKNEEIKQQDEYKK